VVLVSGETGCGKTTQLPQYILEDSLAAGKHCRILCSQPRRVSVLNVSSRVAQERGDAVGQSVGYSIRLESNCSPTTPLQFVTNGILNKMLGSVSVSMAKVTHVIVDEIHERDVHADFALVLLLDVLAARPDLKLVLMSATLQAERFSTFFGGCPVVTVPGRTHPVEEHHLEDVLKLTGKWERVRIRAASCRLSGIGQDWWCLCTVLRCLCESSCAPVHCCAPS
jgi:HrpA-like RNA helicase